MANFGIGPMEVVFSFDTTGSMSQVLDEVKGRISDIVQRLQADIPGFRVGIIAHGDYCDEEHFYVIRSLDLTNSLPDVVTFVNDTEGTGGGDVPECYELAMKTANSFSWSLLSHRILVIIGDAYPHEPDYPLNTAKVDWRQELDELKRKNVKIYGVQVENDEKCTEFFKRLTDETNGQHLMLANMQRICEAIMGVCYREKGPEFFNNFEAEIRQKEPEKVSEDLEDLFGTLRREESRRSDVTALLDDDDLQDFEEVEPVRKSPYTNTIDISTVDIPQGSRKRKAPQGLCIDWKRRRILSEATPIATPNKVPFPSSQPVARPKSTARMTCAESKPIRERVPNTRFEYNHLLWSPWKLAVSPPGPKTEKCGEWKKVIQSGTDRVLWRTDLLDSCPVKTRLSHKSAMVFEISIVTPRCSRKRVVSCHISHAARSFKPRGVFSLPWYRGLFRCVRQELNRAACQNLEIYVRWAKVSSKDRNVSARMRCAYDYAWDHQRNSTPRHVL